MTASSHRITAAAALCAAAAGATFIGVQVAHPTVTLDNLGNAEMTIRESAKAAMCLLAVAGLGGIFIRNRHRLGVVGRVGHVLVSVGYLAMFVVQCVVGFVLPSMVDTDPAYVQDVIDAAMGGTAKGDIGLYPVLFTVAGIGYSIGGLLFGIALFRARVLSRWASALFAYGTMSALALAALPGSFDRPFAVPTGIALIGLGHSLWRDQGSRAGSVDTTSVRIPALATR
ncbi:MAG TPA: hypothetical protein VEA78_02685 [Acidimicrobiales bacterium]|nr:hypothetical protein [Acidimicrobiales bacterium]